jgi:hypothetical protein
MLYMREYCDAEKIDMQDFGAFTPYQHPWIHLTWGKAMKSYGGVQVYFHTFLTQALNGCQLHAPGALSLGSSPQFQLPMRLGGPWANLDTVEKNISCPARNWTVSSNVESIACVAVWTELSWLGMPCILCHNTSSWQEKQVKGKKR